jgi:hypothetical protein
MYVALLYSTLVSRQWQKRLGDLRLLCYVDDIAGCLIRHLHNGKSVLDAKDELTIWKRRCDAMQCNAIHGDRNTIMSWVLSSLCDGWCQADTCRVCRRLVKE